MLSALQFSLCALFGFIGLCVIHLMQHRIPYRQRMKRLSLLLIIFGMLFSAAWSSARIFGTQYAVASRSSDIWMILLMGIINISGGLLLYYSTQEKEKAGIETIGFAQLRYIINPSYAANLQNPLENECIISYNTLQQTIARRPASSLCSRCITAMLPVGLTAGRAYPFKNAGTGGITMLTRSAAEDIIFISIMLQPVITASFWIVQCVGLQAKNRAFKGRKMLAFYIAPYRLLRRRLLFAFRLFPRRTHWAA